MLREVLVIIEIVPVRADPLFADTEKVTTPFKLWDIIVIHESLLRTLVKQFAEFGKAPLKVAGVVPSIGILMFCGKKKGTVHILSCSMLKLPTRTPSPSRISTPPCLVELLMFSTTVKLTLPLPVPLVAEVNVIPGGRVLAVL
jgi:hypothetical protein